MICREAHDFIYFLLLKMTKKFVLKDQGNPECFPILLKYADSLEVIVLDCRGKGSSNENDVDPSSFLTDHHLQNLPLRNRDCIHSLIIRGSTKFSYAGYLTLASCCTHLTALGEYYSMISFVVGYWELFRSFALSFSECTISNPAAKIQSEVDLLVSGEVI
jgi:hypothetical protein